jgi:hypothetical protein
VPFDLTPLKKQKVSDELSGQAQARWREAFIQAESLISFEF